MNETRQIRFEVEAEYFLHIPGSSIAYWFTPQTISLFEQPKIGEICEARKGLATSDNNRFLRLWFEVSNSNIKFDCHSNHESENLKMKWYPHNKGGEFRRWYGNNEYLINWWNNGYEIRNYKDGYGKLLSRPQNLNYNFKQAITWSKITTSNFSARMCSGGFLFDDAAAICHHSDYNALLYVIAFLNSRCFQKMIVGINPTLNIQIGDVANVPIIIDITRKKEIEEYVIINIQISKSDWNSFETSWDFNKHPLI